MYKRLRDMREDNDLKQRELAAHIGCTQVCYSCYEIGRREIPTAVLIKLSFYYGVSVDYLLGLTDESVPYKRKSRTADGAETGKRAYEHVKKLRKERKLNQQAVADYLKCSQVCYSFYEIGRRDIPPQVLVKLAEYYSTSVDYLLGLTDETKPYPRGNG